jgi:hypothetical protein
VGCVVGQAFDQRFHPGAGGAQARPQGIPVLRQQANLLNKQLIGALQFIVAQQQALDTHGHFAYFVPDGLLNVRPLRRKA